MSCPLCDIDAPCMLGLLQKFCNDNPDRLWRDGDRIHREFVCLAMAEECGHHPDELGVTDDELEEHLFEHHRVTTA